jgi:hypothetical protein
MVRLRISGLLFLTFPRAVHREKFFYTQLRIPTSCGWSLSWYFLIISCNYKHHLTRRNTLVDARTFECLLCARADPITLWILKTIYQNKIELSLKFSVSEEKSFALDGLSPSVSYQLRSSLARWEMSTDCGAFPRIQSTWNDQLVEVRRHHSIYVISTLLNAFYSPYFTYRRCLCVFQSSEVTLLADNRVCY